MTGPCLNGRPKTSDSILSDEDVRLARIMHEREGKKRKEIALHFNVDPEYMGKVLSYEIRSRIYID